MGGSWRSECVRLRGIELNCKFLGLEGDKGERGTIFFSQLDWVGVPYQIVSLKSFNLFLYFLLLFFPKCVRSFYYNPTYYSYYKFSYKVFTKSLKHSRLKCRIISWVWLSCRQTS